MVTIKWLGHASFLITYNNMKIYIDPFAGEVDALADIIICTHDHYDHSDLNVIEKIRKDNTSIITTPATALKLTGTINKLRAGDETTVQGITIKAVPAYNIDKAFHPPGFGIGIILTVEDKTIYHTGDTDLVSEIKTIKNIDCMLTPVGGTYTMNAEEASELTKNINPTMAIPMHFGDIVGSKADAEAFKEKTESSTKTKVVILDAGAEIEI